MNHEIRRVTTVVAGMFLALLVAVTMIQFGQASTLRADQRNSRTFYDSFDRDRGPIITRGGQIIASSSKVDDDYSYQRAYPQGELYAPITGYLTVVGSLTGLEAEENAVLAGTADSLSSAWGRMRDLFTGAEPTGGAVEVTVDPAVQQATWDALGDTRGAAVALDAKTGEILAMVSKPSFDPNTVAVHDPARALEAYAALETDPAGPLHNRVISGDLYPPGSTFKLVTAAAALESGEFTADSELEAPRELDLPQSSVKLTNFGDSSCSSSGEMTLADALVVSCNTAFGWLGMELGEAVIAEQAERFGFGQSLAIPLTVTPSTFPTGLDQASLAMSAIGQKDDRVTPLQMAMVAAAIANGGRMMAPHLVRSERDADLQVVKEVTAEEAGRPLSQTNAHTLRQMMIRAAEEGTGRRARVDGVTVGVKT
ncbi:MAG: serine hydrolase, partial [Bifidobacteriaceae bacterium]|nr:serine hydrolase [Bifidobacteriaceae bacterium]